MISRSFPLFLCLSFLLILSACAEEQVPVLQGTVTWIYDGDTLGIDKVGKVRLIGIDAPERENSPRDQYLVEKGVSAARQRQVYQAAKQFNIRHVKGQRVSLTLGIPPRDRHDRLLAYVYLPDGRLLNRVLVEQGLAVVYRRFSFRLKEEFLAAEDKARQSEVGLWAQDR
ncbi:MAG: thermonuclease family protein [Desulfuromonadales bacterium]